MGSTPTTTPWERFEAEARRRWAKLTVADWHLAAGNLAKLASRIQARHGGSLAKVTSQIRLLMFRVRARAVPSRS